LKYKQPEWAILQKTSVLHYLGICLFRDI